MNILRIAFLIIFLTSLKAFALIEEDSIAVYEMDEIQVTEERNSALFANKSEQIRVISKEEISAAPVESINELLEYCHGIDVRQRGGYGVQSDISIRGGSSNQSVVLLNGINITDPQTGHLTMNLPISLNAIERIEILQGPAANINSPKPFAGAINIITNTKNTPNLGVSLMRGQYDLYDAGVTATMPMGKKFTNMLSASHTRSDGYIENTDFKTTTVFYHGKYTGDKQILNIQAGGADKNHGANSFYSSLYPNQFEANRTYFASLSHDWFTFIDISTQVYWRQNADRFELFKDNWNAPEWYGGSNFHRTDILGGAINTQKKWKYGISYLGIDYRKESILSNNIGYDLETPIEGTDSILYTKKYTRDNIGVNFAHKFNTDKFAATIGIAGQWSNDNRDNKMVLLPGLDVSFKTTDEISLYASANKSHRLPTFTERFYQSPTNAGNENLKAELAYTYEIGANIKYDFLDVKASYFYRQGENIIDWIKVPNAYIWQATNITTLNTHGIGLDISTNKTELKEITSFLEQARISYQYLYQAKNSADFSSKYALDNLKHKLDFSLVNKIYGPIFSSWRISLQDREGGYISYENVQSGIETAYEPFVILDARLFWKIKQGIVFAEGSNLLDADYFDIGNVEQPGRWLKFGVNLNFSLK